MKITRSLPICALAALALSACVYIDEGSRSATPYTVSGQPQQSAPVSQASTPSLNDEDTRWATADLGDIASAIANGDITSEEMVRIYLERIDAIDRSGPTLQSVLALNPNALADARRADDARARGETLGPLHGVPVLLKDNIETLDPVATTAGALVLKDNVVNRDAPLAAGLRAAGAIILGKSNLSQWANFRSNESLSGWSALGGQVRNPHMLDRSPCGSSSGSGAATAAGLAAGSVGTETNGSVICPSSANGIVGFKPTVGLVAQSGIIPISSTQDTAGPMTRSVRDAALMLNAMATGPGKTDFTTALSETSLEGKRIGVLRFAVGNNPEVVAQFDAALAVLQAEGATLVDIDDLDLPDDYGDGETKVLEVEFKHTLNAYLANAAPAVEHRTLKDVIAFNKAHSKAELTLFDQDILISSEEQPGIDDEAYQTALETILTASRQNGIDKFLTDNDVTLLVAPSLDPSFMIDAVHGDQFPGRAGAGFIAAIAGYPHLTVPMGTVRGLPVGLSFMSTAGEDANILAAGYDYEQASQMIATPQFYQNAEGVEEIARAMKPWEVE